MNTGAETIACATFAGRIVLMHLGCIRLVFANITLAHIWRPEKPGGDPSLRLLTFFGSAQFPDLGNADVRANLTPTHVWRPPVAKEAF